MALTVFYDLVRWKSYTDKSILWVLTLGFRCRFKVLFASSIVDLISCFRCRATTWIYVC